MQGGTSAQIEGWVDLDLRRFPRLVVAIGLALICAIVIILWITGQPNFMAIRNQLHAEQQTKQISLYQLR